MIRPVDILLEFLKTEQTRGVTHLHLDEEARQSLRELHARTKNGGTTPIQKTQETPSSEPPSPPAVAPKIQLTPEPKAVKIVVDIPVTQASDPASEQLDSIRRQIEKSAAIQALGSLRETMVFGSGSPNARIMLVGEAPGYHEEREERPFAGEAGQKLTDILKAMGLTREQVYLTYIVKYRPMILRQTTNNRQPTPEEMAACLPWLRAEIAIIQPTCIIALGETAVMGLLGLSGSIASTRGSWHEFNNTPVRISYHPSILLQTQSGLTTKRQLWEDMLAVMEKIDMPISDKQRSFFLPKD